MLTYNNGHVYFRSSNEAGAEVDPSPWQRAELLIHFGNQRIS